MAKSGGRPSCWTSNAASKASHRALHAEKDAAEETARTAVEKAMGMLLGDPKLKALGVETVADVGYLGDAELDPLLVHMTAVERGKFKRGLAHLVEDNPLAGLLTPHVQAKFSERLREKFHRRKLHQARLSGPVETAEWGVHGEWESVIESTKQVHMHTCSPKCMHASGVCV